MGEKVNIYLDDVRDTPYGFIRAFSFEECLYLVIKHYGNIGVLSLDHDLGSENGKDGNDILLYLEEQVFFNRKYSLPEQINIHSENNVATEEMLKTLKSINYLVKSY